VTLPTPRFAVPATDRPSYGHGLAQVAKTLGIPLMPWQRLVAEVALEHVDGQLAYRDVAVATPRQSGKSSLVLALVVYRMAATPRQRVVYGAQTRLAARTKLFDVPGHGDRHVIAGLGDQIPSVHVLSIRMILSLWASWRARPNRPPACRLHF
jgi:hypothetical protein